MGYKKIRIACEVITKILQCGTAASVPLEPAPRDLAIVAARLSPMRPETIELLVASESFEDAGDSFEDAPEWMPLFKRVEPTAIPAEGSG